MLGILEKRSVRMICTVVPALFLCELFLGFNGAQLVVAGLSIRKILFLLSVLALYIPCIFFLLSKSRKEAVAYFKKFDLLPAIFLLANGIWMFLIPAINGVNAYYAFGDYSALFVILLYFPTAVLLRAGVFRYRNIESFVLNLSCVLAVVHLVFYVCGRFDMSFGIKFFDLLHKLSGGTSVIQQVILGENYVRVIFPTTVFLLVGLYVILRRHEALTKWDGLKAALLFLAILTTMTRSLWVGTALSFAAYIVLTFILCVKDKRRFLKKAAVVLLVVAAAVTMLNYMVFDGNLFGRLTGNENGQEQTETVYPAPDGEGNVRADQTKALLKQFFEKPLFGWGYGSYVPDYIRSETEPYSYEMFLPSLLMKTGIIGAAVWVAAVVALLWLTYLLHKKDFPAVLFLFLSFFLMVQTNPFLFNFCGMGVLCFLFLTLETKE